MKPKINVLEEVDGILQPVTREMNEEEYAEHLEMTRMAENDTEEA